METIRLKIDGMTCQGCVRSVKRVLEQVAGVSSTEVSLEAGEACITFDPARTSPNRLRIAVAEAGYEAA